MNSLLLARENTNSGSKETEAVEDLDDLRKQVGYSMLDRLNKYNDVLPSRARELTLQLRATIEPLISMNSQQAQDKLFEVVEELHLSGLQIHVRNRLSRGPLMIYYPREDEVHHVKYCKPEDRVGRTMDYVERPALIARYGKIQDLMLGICHLDYGVSGPPTFKYFRF